MTEETSTSATAPKPAKQPRINPQDIRNSDLVSRLLAATPPYLYSPPIGPPNFFFSEMLRSLVQNKTNEQTNRQLSQQIRKPRKRSWNQPTRFLLDGSHNTHNIASGSKEPNIEVSDNKIIEKPLELTNKLPSFISPTKLYKSDSSSPDITARDKEKESQMLSMKMSKTLAVTTQSEPPIASLPPADLVLPPPPPIWYPPLYPPYGIDPLHFFIDLRVSGQFLDRKKENVSPNQADNENLPALNNTQIGKYRHKSAFTVPPRKEKSPLALNLVTDPTSEYNNNNNHIEDNSATKNTNYVLQNLPRIYTTLTSKTDDSNFDEIENKSDSDTNEAEARSDIYNKRCNDDNSNDVVIVDQDTESIE